MRLNIFWTQREFKNKKSALTSCFDALKDVHTLALNQRLVKTKINLKQPTLDIVKNCNNIKTNHEI